MQVDRIFTDAKIYNVFLKEWETADIFVLGGKILHIGNRKDEAVTADHITECGGKPLIPGFIDIHLHIESTFCTPKAFAEAVLPLGVTTVVAEPHEIANIFGLAGIEEMLKVSREAVMDIFYSIPSSVPSTNSSLETTGGSIGTEELDELMRNHPEVICLGEVMNYSTIIRDFGSENAADKPVRMINLLRERYPLAAVEGHCPSVRGMDLSKLLYTGIDSDHCLQDIEGMHQRFARGMFVELQEKSVTKEIVEYLKTRPVDGEYCFVTDDVSPDILQDRGHLDHVVRKAMGYGLSLEKVITATSLAPARRMGFRDRGVIAPGKLADFILLEDSSPDLKINKVFKSGIPWPEKKNVKGGTPGFGNAFLSSIRLEELKTEDSLFRIMVPDKRRKTVKCRIMRKNDVNTYTQEEIITVPAENDILTWNGGQMNLVMVIERYSGKGGYSKGLTSGDIIRNGAFCSSYSHDHHNILLAGDNASDMKIALEWMKNSNGGMCTVSGGEITSSIHLPVGGIISDKPVKLLAEDLRSIQSALESMGINHPNPVMSMCTLTLPVSPELKITDKGLIRVSKAEKVSLFV